MVDGVHKCHSGAMAVQDLRRERTYWIMLSIIPVGTFHSVIFTAYRESKMFAIFCRDLFTDFVYVTCSMIAHVKPNLQ